MTTKRKTAPKPSEAPVVAPQASEGGEEEVKNSSTSPSEVAKITLEHYLRKTAVNPGLVASFKVEARKEPNALEPKTEEEWKEAFHAQSIRKY